MIYYLVYLDSKMIFQTLCDLKAYAFINDLMHLDNVNENRIILNEWRPAA